MNTYSTETSFTEATIHRFLHAAKCHSKACDEADPEETNSVTYWRYLMYLLNY